MTKGIIQRVFNQDLKGYKGNPHLYSGNDIYRILQLKQQELIKEIRKEYCNTQHGLFIIRLEKLIGET